MFTSHKMRKNIVCKHIVNCECFVVCNQSFLNSFDLSRKFAALNSCSPAGILKITGYHFLEDEHVAFFILRSAPETRHEKGELSIWTW